MHQPHQLENSCDQCNKRKATAPRAMKHLLKATVNLGLQIQILSGMKQPTSFVMILGKQTLEKNRA